MPFAISTLRDFSKQSESRSPSRGNRTDYKAVAILVAIISALFLLQSLLPLRTAIKIGADEDFELAKATLALIGPVGCTHDPGDILLEALKERHFPQAIDAQVRRIAECAEHLGSEVHLESAYGDEATRRTPWEIFDEKKARDALQFAEETVALAKQVAEGGLRP